MAINFTFDAPAKTYKTQGNALKAYTKFVSEHPVLCDADLRVTMAVTEDGRFHVVTHLGLSNAPAGYRMMDFLTVFACNGFCIVNG